jgi:F0F1-type ATP synthase assembly protein I
VAVSIGAPFGVLVSSGAFGGHLLDAKFDTSPWLTLAGIAVGSVAAFVNMFRVLAWWQRKSGDAPPER